MSVQYLFLQESKRRDVRYTLDKSNAVQLQQISSCFRNSSCRVIFVCRALDILRYMQTSDDSSACVDVTINRLLDYNLSAKYAVTGRLSECYRSLVCFYLMQ
jgi:hypothetical protein